MAIAIRQAGVEQYPVEGELELAEYFLSLRNIACAVAPEPAALAECTQKAAPHDGIVLNHQNAPHHNRSS
jgi:hypothetical protein